MDLNRYKIFLSVADSGSFTAAAAAWNYTTRCCGAWAWTCWIRSC